MAKILVRTKNGAMVRMNEAALKMAQRHFGVGKTRPETKEVPIELLTLPKQLNISPPVEIKKEVKVEAPIVPEVIEEPVVEVKKTTRKKKYA